MVERVDTPGGKRGIALVRPRLVGVVQEALAVVCEHRAVRRHQHRGVVARRLARLCGLGGGGDLGIANGDVAAEAARGGDGPGGGRAGSGGLEKRSNGVERGVVVACAGRPTNMSLQPFIRRYGAPPWPGAARTHL